MTVELQEQILKVKTELEKLASMTTGGGLYIEDMDCSGGIYSLYDIMVTEEGHIKMLASMWSPSELAKKTGYFRD